VSTSRLGTWLAAVVVVGGLATLTVYNWEGWDGRRPERADPQLLAEGTSGGAAWSVVQVRERGGGDCLYLRQNGATVTRACTEPTRVLQYEVGVHHLRDAAGPLLFGVLPDAAARVEAAEDGGDTRARFRRAELFALEVRTFGEGGRFVVQAAPANPGWRDRSSAMVDVYDAADRQLVPDLKRPG
jgi:hypothetical protein